MAFFSKNSLSLRLKSPFFHIIWQIADEGKMG